MGQKVHPIGMRLGITKEYLSTWFDTQDFANNLLADLEVRRYLKQKYPDAQIASVKIERPTKTNAKIIIYSARPGILIGQKGKGIDQLRLKLSQIMRDVVVHLTVEEIKKPELTATLVAEQVAKQLEQRVPFRRAIKKAISAALRAGAQGIKVSVAGRLGGAEIARTEWYREGRVPLHTFRADIDYSLAEAKTTFGIIGVKVWIFKGEKLGKSREAEAKQQPLRDRKSKKKD